MVPKKIIASAGNRIPFFHTVASQFPELSQRIKTRVVMFLQWLAILLILVQLLKGTVIMNCHLLAA
jgi:hypothetical protein